MSKVYIVAAKRTAIGSFGGRLANVSLAKLAGGAIRGALASQNIAPTSVQEVILGNVMGADQGMGPGRQASLDAGIPQSVPAYSLNMVCGSGMKAIMDASSHIRSGDADVVVAAGAEAMSQIPFAAPASLRQGQKMGNLTVKDLLITDGLTDVFNQCHMGVTAENIVRELGISREQQDNYALSSQHRAEAALNSGRFADEIVALDVVDRRQTVSFADDEYPKKGCELADLAKLRPAFEKEGTVTAGNASGLNDGASAVVLMSEKAMLASGCKPLAEVVSYAQIGLDPAVMGLGPVDAVNQALNKAQLTLSDIDLLELNEAFAAQALGVVTLLGRQHQLSVEHLLERTNVNGGAIALGHPLGASGNRIVVTLIHEMHKRQSQYGLASLCIGGGMGTALILRRC
ncbi:acetyl-CoA C-acetyltransferase [Shewanella sp. SNU WT4]|uniref:acetyl-CoA C-acetyltransferase n=1 Tax=Shewanella sp. SNU WT4 TaxID=2590015 RepID=UPI00112828C3|nr:acetyl-CoA C-acetyltransferase [Shewanella sp. SNU WT4]QDF67393.1 acetyl-CoA C-acetyltransferase [Shewanella sp. SNU WT4]